MKVTIIECRPDGPYKITGLETLNNSRGEPLRLEATVALCRCGGSANKPYCDGSHKSNGFSGARQSDGSRDKSRVYPGGAVTIRDNRSICAHAAHCIGGLPGVFKQGAKPWIEPSGADVAAVVAAVARCPSGALGCSVDGKEAAVESGPARIAIGKDGPYAVRGSVELIGATWAEGAARDRFTLCRCGASKNKPFCDGSHAEAGFGDAQN